MFQLQIKKGEKMINELVERLENNLEKIQGTLRRFYENPNKSVYTIGEIIIFEQTIEEIKQQLRIWGKY